MARKMANQEKKHKKQIEAQLSELGTAPEKKRYLENEKQLALGRIQKKIAKGRARFKKMNADQGVEKESTTSHKPGSDEKLPKRIKLKMASLEAEEGDGEQIAKGCTGCKRIKSEDKSLVSYRREPSRQDRS